MNPRKKQTKPAGPEYDAEVNSQVLGLQQELGLVKATLRDVIARAELLKAQRDALQGELEDLRWRVGTAVSTLVLRLIDRGAEPLETRKPL